MVEILSSICLYLKKYAISSKKFMYGFMLGLIVCIALIYFFIKYLGINNSELFYFITNNKRIYCYEIFEKYLESMINNFSQLETVSINRQRKLWKYIEKQSFEGDNIVESEVLDISNRDRDILRAYLEYNKFALHYIKLKKLNDNSFNILNNISDAYYLMHLDSDKNYYKASNILQENYDKAENYDYLRLEIIRSLTFCNFAMKNKESAEFWKNKALKIRLSKEIALKEYITRFFWIDLNDFYLSIEKNDLKNAESAFLRMKDSSDPDFMRIKLKQHLKRVSQEKQKIWQEYIDNITF